MTFSIVARCAQTGMFGVAVSSSSPAVAARCAHARPGVGAVATQNFTDPTLGRRGLDLLERGATADQAIAILSSTASDSAFRQLLAVGASDVPAAFTGSSCIPQTGSALTEHAAAAGNLLSSPEIPTAMTAAFTGADGHLASRLLRAMRAGLEAGGEVEAVRSAGILVMNDVPWAIVDLRVDWTDKCPITELERLWSVWEPRMQLYLARALNPAQAPVSDEPVRVDTAGS
ncbi:DUF1028 domain-containing protein [Lichenihabitans psoromatis]|uniref:DUF1028 domain-containing protein n=1 Tax=Lichenihabitans psoromatis TaxID=2528642 RepID=UPI001035FBA2|nr:DUF1028 domain-containing protein [Lichenihabitans psoromatis]